MKRFYPRYIDRQDGTDLYVVVDSDTGEFVSERVPFHEANDCAGRRNKEAVSAERHAAWDVPLDDRPLCIEAVEPFSDTWVVLRGDQIITPPVSRRRALNFISVLRANPDAEIILVFGDDIRKPPTKLVRRADGAFQFSDAGARDAQRLINWSRAKGIELLQGPNAQVVKYPK